MQNNKQNRNINCIRKDLLYTNKFPTSVSTIENLLTIWPELEDITTDKYRKKSYCVLRDKDDCFKIFFFKSGFVKKFNDNNTQHMFLNNWSFNYNINNIEQLFAYSFDFMIQKTHEFMISKKILKNVDMFFYLLNDKR